MDAPGQLAQLVGGLLELGGCLVEQLRQRALGLPACQPEREGERDQALLRAVVQTTDAVSQGIRSTAGVVTSAAAIMVAVFGAFATVSSLDMQQMGLGLAVAVLIDATVIRAVLLPAAMQLLGDWNWWLPRRFAAAARRPVADPSAAAA